MNFLQMKKYYLLIKEERYKKLTLLILVWENLSEKKTKKKQSKTKKKKQTDAVANQRIKIAAITNKDNDHEKNYIEIFEELVKERFDEIKQLTNEINQNDSIYYFKGNTGRKRFCKFNNDIKRFEKIKYVEIKLKEAKKLQNVLKSNLNEISRERHKSKEQKSALENIKLLCKSRESVNKLFNDYSSVAASQAKYKSIHGKRPKIVSPKQMLQ